MAKNENLPVAFARLTAVVTGGKGYGISHSWDGSVLTVTSDSGSSSADLLGPAGTGVFVVELRQENGTYTADKSFDELKEHIDAGDVVVCDFIAADSRIRCALALYTSYSAAFVMQSVFGADEYFYITADGVTHLVSKVGEDKMPSQVEVVKNGNAITVTATVSGSLGGWGTEVTTITLDEDGYPKTVTRDDGTTTTLTWEGFD